MVGTSASDLNVPALWLGQAARPEPAAGFDEQAGDYLRGDPGGHPLAEPELAGRRDEAVQVRFERTTAGQLVPELDSLRATR